MADLPARTRAMNNEMVLELIATKMPLEDLRPLRGTCPAWNRAFSPAVRDKQQIMKLLCASKPDCERNQNAHTVHDYVELMQKSQEIPLGKYYLEDVYAASYQELKEFFDLCGPIVTRLDFNTHHDNSTSTIEKIRWIVFDQTPNLKELRLVCGNQFDLTNKKEVFGVGQTLARDLPNLRKLEFGVSSEHEWRPMLSILLTDLLRHAIGLKSFSTSSSYDNGMNNLAVLSAIRDHASPPCLANLTTIKMTKLDVAHLELLLELAIGRKSPPLRLRVFFASLEYRNERQAQIMQKLRQFLGTQANTLHRFSLDILSGGSQNESGVFPGSSRIQLPTMPVLRSFRLYRENLDFGSLAPGPPFETQLPSLVRFEYLYDQYGLSGPDFDDLSSFRHSGATDFRLDTKFMIVPRDADMFRRIYGNRIQFQFMQMQLVTRLEIWLRVSRQYIFTRICSAMPALEVLQVVFRNRGETLFCNDDEEDDLDRAGVMPGKSGVEKDGVHLELDSLLSGVPRNNLMGLKQELAQLEAQPDGIILAMLQNTFQNHKEVAGLQDLQNLKKLMVTICTHAFPYSYRLTNVGGYFGLCLASSTLQHIAIGVGNRNGKLEAGRRNECSTSRGGSFVSEECQAMIQSVMAPFAVLQL